MIRTSIALLSLISVSGYAASPESDEITKRLNAAKTAYQIECDKLDASVQEFLDDWEAKSRSRGDKNEVDSAKTARQNFITKGKVPTTLPAKIGARIVSARTRMEKAYAIAIRDYTKSKDDSAASMTEKELTAFQSPIGLNAMVLIGTWKMTIESWSANLTFGSDGTVTLWNAKFGDGRDDPVSIGSGKWSFDLEKSRVLINWESGNSTSFLAPIDAKQTNGVELTGNRNRFTAVKIRDQK